jgi:hypothetical protein
MFENGKATPSAPATSTGVSTWNGNIIVMDFNMMFGEHEFKGEARYSFDTVQRKFQSIWIDNMATGQYVGESKTISAPVVAGQPYTIELFSDRATRRAHEQAQDGSFDVRVQCRRIDHS